MERIVDINELEGLNYEQGSALLEQAGYVEGESFIDTDSPYYDKIYDTYFSLFEEDTKIDVKCFSQYCNKKEEKEEEEDDDLLAEWDREITLLEKWGQY